MNIVLVILVVALFFGFIALSVYIVNQEQKTSNEKHHCNVCKKSFLFTKKDLQRTHCPYCKRELTKYIKNPDYIEWNRTENGNDND